MIVRSAPLLAAVVFGCFATPALAQDKSAGPPPLPEFDAYDLPPPPEVETYAPLPGPAGDGGWQGEWDGEWAEDGTYHGTWNGTYSDPGPTAARAIYPGGVPNSGFPAAERIAWLNQCRNVYYPGSAATGAVVAAQSDVCESYLQQYEHSYAMAAQGAAPAGGAYAALPVTPGAYAPGGYGYGSPYAPVMWVRVPIVRQAAAPAIEAGE